MIENCFLVLNSKIIEIHFLYQSAGMTNLNPSPLLRLKGR